MGSTEKLRQARVLILEDDPGIAELQRRTLERAGHTAVVSYRPEEALDLLNASKFDLIVLDYKLNGPLTGVDFYRTLLAHDIKLPAILVTGFGDERVLIEAIRAGVRDFVPKTASHLDDLGPAVDRAMSQIVVERKLAESEALRESQEKLTLAYEEIKALNERLRLAMTETHHRVKNSLQVLGSLLNFQLRDEKALTKEDVRRLIAHIHGFAALHDLLTLQMRDEGETSTVSLPEILERLIEVFNEGSIGRELKAELCPCHVSERHASSLAVVFNELISNALKHGVGHISVSLSCSDENGELVVQNSLADPNEKFEVSGGTGLKLIRNLCRADFGVEPKFETANEQVTARVVFPLRPVEDS